MENNKSKNNRNNTEHRTDFHILWRTELFSLDPFRILLDSVQEDINNWILSVSALAILGM